METFSTCAYHDGFLYYYSDRNGILSRVDIVSGKAKYIRCKYLTNADIVFFHHDDFYNLAIDGHALVKHDIRQDQDERIELDCGINAWGNYIAAHRVDSKLYVVCRGQNKIAEIDLSDGTVSYHRHRIQAGAACYSGCVLENRIWMFPNDGGTAVCLSLPELHETETDLGCTFHDAYSCITYKNKIYLSTRRGSVFELDVKNSRMAEIVTGDAAADAFNKIIVSEEKIILLPALGERIKVVHRKSNAVETYGDYPDDFAYGENKTWSKYYGYAESPNDYYFAPRGANYILKVTKEDCAISWIKYIPPSKYDLIEWYMATDRTVTETAFGLNVYLDYVKRSH